MSEETIRVLLVEDEIEFANSLRQILGLVSPSLFEVSHADRFSDMLEQLGKAAPEVILLDLSLPDRRGLDTYTDLKALWPLIPTIILTGLDDERLAVQAVRSGAQDYLVKGQFDSRILSRVIRYAIERKRTEEALRQSEEFFRLISENVTDLIAVIDSDGKRIYNSPSYKTILGAPESLRGTDSFEEVHPQDRKRIKDIFRETLASGVGRRTEYRFLLKDGSVRDVESQGSVIRDETGRPSKLVVVSRDITERKETVQLLRNALADLKKSHDELKATQLQLIQAERLEAVSTFAAGIAHEVKNPLQTLILGIDFLANHVVTDDEKTSALLGEMTRAVKRADGVIRGLLEFSAHRKQEIKQEDLNGIVEQSLQSVQQELKAHPVKLVATLEPDLPRLKLDAKTLKHVFISLFVNSIGAMPQGGTLAVRTYPRHGNGATTGESDNHSRQSVYHVVAEVEATPHPDLTDPAATVSERGAPGPPSEEETGFRLAVLRKIVGLFGGAIDCSRQKEAGNKYTIVFKP